MEPVSLTTQESVSEIQPQNAQSLLSQLSPENQNPLFLQAAGAT